MKKYADKPFRTKCQAVTTGGRVRGVCQSLEELQEEVNDFYQASKSI